MRSSTTATGCRCAARDVVRLFTRRGDGALGVGAPIGPATPSAAGTGFTGTLGSPTVVLSAHTDDDGATIFQQAACKLGL
jgi:hypothetical protein